MPKKTGINKILILGHSGKLGSALLRMSPAPCHVFRNGRAEFDLTDPQKVNSSIASAGCDLVINCAAYTDVDGAEKNPDLAFTVNAQGAGHVARACGQAGLPLVHISTDYVFSGDSPSDYTEQDAPAPLSAYGRSKLEGEKLVLEKCPGALVVRTAWLFGPGKPGFVGKVVNAFNNAKKLDVVCDQLGNPTFSDDAASAVLNLALAGARGVVHAANKGCASRLDLAKEAVRLSGGDPEAVRPIYTSDLPPAAQRPARACLDTSRYEAITGARLRPWREALAQHLARG